MIDDFFTFDGVDEAVLRRERDKARELRKTGWWRNKIDKGVCHYCGGVTAAKDLTMDHVVPLMRGGKSSKANLVASCKDCNNKKKTMLPIEWDDYMTTLEKQSRGDSA